MTEEKINQLWYQSQNASVWEWRGFKSQHQYFAHLVLAAERDRQKTTKEWSDHDRAVAAAEREECIESARTVGGDFAVECERLIRARGQE